MREYYKSRDREPPSKWAAGSGTLDYRLWLECLQSTSGSSYSASSTTNYRTLLPLLKKKTNSASAGGGYHDILNNLKGRVKQQLLTYDQAKSATREWKESEHPRGQPTNKGQFAKSDKRTSSLDNNNNNNNTNNNAINYAKNLEKWKSLESRYDTLVENINTFIQNLNIPDEYENDALYAPISGNTNPNNVVPTFEAKQAWDKLASQNPQFRQLQQEYEALADEVNDFNAKAYNMATSIWRGTSTNELDNIIKRGELGSHNYSFVSTSLTKGRAAKFGRMSTGVTLEFDKNAVQNSKFWNGVPVNPYLVKYDPYSSNVGTGSEEIRNPFPLYFSHEREVRVPPFTMKNPQNYIKSITLTHFKESDSPEMIQQSIAKYQKHFPNAKVTSQLTPDRETMDEYMDNADSSVSGINNHNVNSSATGIMNNYHDALNKLRSTISTKSAARFQPYKDEKPWRGHYYRDVMNRTVRVAPGEDWDEAKAKIDIKPPPSQTPQDNTAKVEPVQFDENGYGNKWETTDILDVVHRVKTLHGKSRIIDQLIDNGKIDEAVMSSKELKGDFQKLIDDSDVLYRSIRADRLQGNKQNNRINIEEGDPASFSLSKEIARGFGTVMYVVPKNKLKWNTVDKVIGYEGTNDYDDANGESIWKGKIYYNLEIRAEPGAELPAGSKIIIPNLNPEDDKSHDVFAESYNIDAVEFYEVLEGIPEYNESIHNTLEKQKELIKKEYSQNGKYQVEFAKLNNRIYKYL